MLENVLKAYGLNDKSVIVDTLSAGLINQTWKIRTGNNTLIVQQLNTNVFKQPEIIANNIAAIAEYLKINAPDYIFTSPLLTINGESMLKHENAYFRIFSFIDGSHTITKVQTSEQAYEASFQFGNFTHVLKDFDLSYLQPTIPDFHNLSLRYKQYLAAIKTAHPSRIKMAMTLIDELHTFTYINSQFENFVKNSACKQRVVHHDAKISNVLFDNNDRGICVIDLDTIMPGYFISDVGDMMRTYLCSVTEEETDYDKIEIRKYFFEAISTGYCEALQNELSITEKEHFLFAGKFIVYMQALRFLTDYFQNDVYYGAKYATHNLNRAKNQTILLQKLARLND